MIDETPAFFSRWPHEARALWRHDRKLRTITLALSIYDLHERVIEEHNARRARR